MSGIAVTGRLRCGGKGHPMNRQLTVLIFSAVLLLSSPAWALEISVTDAALTRGSEGSVTVKFKDNPLKDVYAIDIAFDFDAKAFRLDRIEKGPAVAGFQLVENRELGPDRAQVALIGLFPLNADTGDLLTLHFTALKNKKHSRDNALNITHVQFSTDDTALIPDKIVQGKLILSR